MYFLIERKLKPPAGAVQARPRDPGFNSAAPGLRVSSRTDEHGFNIQYFYDKTSTYSTSQQVPRPKKKFPRKTNFELVSTENHYQPRSIHDISRFRSRLDVVLRLRVSTSPYPHFSPRA
jgi:hypothetical protein